jgi:hypothetical protein
LLGLFHTKRVPDTVTLTAAREELRIKDRDEGQAKRQEILRRLNTDDELLGTTETNSDLAKEERQRKLKDEIEKEQEINRGWFFRRFGAGS